MINFNFILKSAILSTKLTKSTISFRKSLVLISAIILAFATNVNAQQPAIHLDGTDDRINVGSLKFVSTGTAGQFTIEGWVKVTAYNTSTGSWIFGDERNSNKGVYLMISPDGNIQTYVPPALPTNSTAVVALDTWTHIALVQDASNVKLYVNGTFVQNVGSSPNLLEETNANAYFGAFTANNSTFLRHFNGSLDDWRIWNVARTASEISSNMNCDIDQHSNLVAYYRFDQGIAGESNTSLVSAADYSGNNHCATLTNFALSGSTSNYVAGAIATSCVTMNPALGGIGGSLNVARGQTTTLTNSGTGGRWSTSDTTIAKVNATTGLVSGISPGTCSVSYTSLSCTTLIAGFTVTVKPGLHFDGSNDRVDIGTPVPANSSYTKEAWIYAENLIGARNIVSSQSTPFWITDGTLAAGQGNNYTLVTSTSFPVNTWVHVAVTYDQPTSTMKLYKNGDLVATNTSVPDYAGDGMLLGSHVGGSIFHGTMDEVRVWKIARTQAQIQAAMNCDITGNSNLVAYYRFNEGTASGTNTSIAKAVDYSGKGNCGTFVNFQLTGSTSNYVPGWIGQCIPITVNPSAITGSLTLKRGQTTNLDNTVSSGVWTSGDTSVAKINSSTGVVTGYSPGTSIITFTAFCKSVTATVTVSANPGMHFDGVNDFVQVNSDPEFHLYNGTVECWMKTNNFGSWYRGMIVNHYGYGIFLYNSKLGVYDWTDGNTYTSTTDIADSQWHHVAFTFQNGVPNGSNLYVDGVSELDFTYNINFNGYGLSLGAGDFDGSGQQFAGNLDEVRIWNTVRTQSEIQASMNCDVAQQAGLVGYYRFDEGTANGDNTALTEAIDYSGYNNCGLLKNFAQTGTSSNFNTGSIGSCNTITPVTPGTISGTLTVTNHQTTDLNNTVAGGQWSSGNTDIATVNATTGVVTGLNVGTADITYTLFCHEVVTTVTVNAEAGLSFSGASYLSFNNDLSTVTNFTYEAWVKPYAITWWSRILDFGNAPELNIFFTNSFDGTGIPRFVINIGAGEQMVTSSQALPINTWSHLAVTLSGDTATMYVNGEIVGQNTDFSLNPSDLGATINNWIGKSQYPDDYFYGQLDEVRMWNVARTQTQIQENMNCDVPLDTNYRFNEGTPGANNGSITSATDYSGNEHCGTFNNFSLDDFISNYVSGAIGTCNTITLSTPGTTTGTLAFCAGTTSDLDNSVSGGHWSSTNTAVATVDPSTGVVTGISGGEAQINYSISCNLATVTVTINPVPDAGTISGSSAVCVGSSQSLSTTGIDGVWSSSNTAKADFDGPGTLFGIEAGTTVISYISSNSCGPNDTATFAVTVNPIPGEISGGLTVCPGSLTVLTNTPGGGTWSSPDATVTVNATNGKVTGVSSGTALISYTIPGGCAATTVVTITSPMDPITGTLALCPGSNTTLIPGATGGTWSSSSVTKASINSSTGEVTAISSGVAVITYTTGSGCYTTVPFTVNPIPAAITGALTVCPGTTSDLNSTTTGGVWSSSNPAIATVNSSTGLVGSVAGAGTSVIEYAVGGLCPRTVTVTIAASSPNVGTPVICLGQPTAVTPLSNATPGGLWTSSNPARIEVSPSTGVMNGLTIGTAVITYSLNAGCFSTTVVSVTAAVNAITGVTNICPGNTTTLTCPTAGGTWSSSNSSVASTGTGAVVTGISAGIATITYQTSPGCYKTTNLTVNGAMTDITGIDTVCIGATTTLSSGPAGGTWSSSNTARATINVTSGVARGISAGTTTITYKLGSSGCMTTKVITINPSVPVITGTANVCPGATTTLLNAVADGTWSSSNTSKATIDASSGIVTGIAQGTSVVTYMASPTCYRTTIQSVNAAPAAIGGPASVCTDNTITLSSSGSGTWSSTNTAAATISSAGILRGIAAGVTTISYIITGTGCSNAVDISVNPVPANITGTLTACVGATTTVASAPGGGIWSSSNPIKATVDASSGVVSSLQAGTANITYTLATGCYKKAIVTLSSVPAPINGVDSVCVGLTTALSTTTGGGSWSSTNTAAATVNPTSGLVRGVDAGVSTISYRFTSGCASVRQITVNGLPDAITGGTNICIGAPQTLASSGGGVWSSSNTLKATVNAGSGQVSGISAGSANITYTLPTGCYRKTLVNINTSPAPISGAASVNFGATTTLTCTPGGGSWSSFDADIASVIATNGIVTGVNEGTTTIKYELANGCYSTTEISVTTPAGRQHVAGTEKNTSRLFSITPNPTSGVLNIATSETGMFAVFTMDGKMVSQTPIAGTTTQVVLPSDLATGMYLCKFTTGNGLTELARIVLSH